MQKDGRRRMERWKEWRVARRAWEGVIRIFHLNNNENLDSVAVAVTTHCNKREMTQLRLLQ